MAFNFNWLPLGSTSSAFYEHAKTLLTAALNKSAKPPIIVDDILVDDLDLGESAPDLEILEIGDIAEDRFRGIFRMNYEGGAFLTLRTKVQANPLNTYLSTTPEFTSPKPLEASSPLTIPVQITLSEFKLCGFVVLVFSKAKGITLVFRDDPLQSLKVSSTFDSIPFIAEYLQKEIERQVRRLFQEDLPVAVHRLSLGFWNPEYAASLDEEATSPTRAAPSSSDDDDSDLDDLDSEPFLNPLLAPTENNSEVFSQRTMVHLASLADSQQTLSLFTPGLRDAVFRASPSAHYSASGATWERVDDTPDSKSVVSSVSSHRPSLSTHTSVSVPPISTAAPSRPPTTPSRRKRKHRVVNLRAPKEPREQQRQQRPPPTLNLDKTFQAPEVAVVEDEAPIPMKPQHHRDDSIDYDSRPNSPHAQMPASGKEKEDEAIRHVEQVFVKRVVEEVRRRIAIEREGRGGKVMWDVERELENLALDDEELPAYHS